MVSNRRFLPAVVLCTALTGILPAQALAGGPAPAGRSCPSRTVCDTTLGIALMPAAGWLLLSPNNSLPPNKFPPHTLAFGTHPSAGLSYNLRLIVQPYAMTSIRDDTRAAKWLATKTIRAERVASTTQRPVSYGGSTGVLIKGLPGGPGPAVDIVLARQGTVYLIIAPGRSLAPDQRRALASLRFIPRTGNFLPPVGG